jgi:phage/plasmid primase-like uncharacterized protein
MKQRYTKNDILDGFLNAMRDNGIAPRESIVLDTFTRFDVEGDKKGSKNGFYILHSDGLPAGHFGCNKRGIAENWCIKNANELTDIERAEFHAQMEQAKLERAKQDAAKRDAARIKAEKRVEAAKAKAMKDDAPIDDLSAQLESAKQNLQSVGDEGYFLDEPPLVAAREEVERIEKLLTTAPIVESEPDTRHPYLIKKDAQNYGLLNEGENLLIAARDVNGKVWTAQTISPNGDKRFQAGGKKQGCFHLIGNEIEKNGFNQLIVLVEGYATGATAYDALNKKYPVAVCFDSGNLEPAALALREKYPRLKILIAGDNDAFTEKNAGKDKAQKAFYALTGGAAYLIPDFNKLKLSNDDVIQDYQNDLAEYYAALSRGEKPIEPSAPSKSKKNREERVQKIFAAMREKIKELKPTDFNDMAALLGIEAVSKQLERGIERIGLIEVEGGKLIQILHQIENEMIFYGNHVYQRTGSLVRPVREKQASEKGISIPDSTLMIHQINSDWLIKHFSKVARWEKDGALIDAEKKYTDIYLSSVGEWKLPVLHGIIECPTLRRDGTLLNQSGYDKESGLYVDYQGEKVNVIDRPTKQDALDALEILKQPLKDFPFLAEIDRAVIIAAMLTAVVRRSLSTAPMFAIDAPIMGSGKSLLSDIVAMLATGRKAIVVSQGRDETEDEKRLGALLMRGVPLLNLDNIERPVSGEMLCSILTQQQVSSRVLGQSKIVDLPTNVTMLATGNNLIFKGDMVRRVLLCQLDPQCERPDARKFDVDLNQWIPANRHKLLGAALTVMRAYIHAGKPLTGEITAYGSFDDWNNLIRASLLWLGVDDPMETRQRLESSDPVKSELGAVLPLWYVAFNNNGKTAAEIVELCELSHHADLKHALMDVAISKRGDSIDAKRLGQWIKRYLNRVENGFRFEQARKDGNTHKIFWRVSKIASIASIASIVSNPEKFQKKEKEKEKDFQTTDSEKQTSQTSQYSQTDFDSDIEEF